MADFGRSRRLSAVLGNSGVSESSYQSYVLKPGVGDLVRPSWEDPTVLRILPGLNPDNLAEFDPWRLSLRPDDYGQWFFPVDVANVSCEANNKASRAWILKDPFDNGYDSMRNPLVILRNAVKSAIQQKLPHAINWYSLVQSGNGRSAELDGPASCWLIRCFLLEHAGKRHSPPRGFAEDSKTVYMLLKVSAVNALKRAMEQKKEGFRGDPTDIASHYVFGDPISLHDGAYVTIFNREKDPRQAGAPQGGYNPYQSNSRGSYGGQQQVKGYDCFLTKDYHGGTANLADYEQVVKTKVIEWHSAVHIPSNEEQVRYLEQVYRPYSDMLVYALDDTYGSILDQGVRREGLTKLGRMRPTEAAYAHHSAAPQEVEQPASFPQAAPVAQAPRQAASPFGAAPAAPPVAEVTAPASPFAAQGWPSNVVPAHRSSESPDNPTSTRGTEQGNISVPTNLVSDDDTNSALRLMAKVRDNMRGGAMPQPNSSN